MNGRSNNCYKYVNCPPVREKDSCGVQDSPSLAMAYVPWQVFYTTFDLAKALQVGTLFPELYKPFCGKGGTRG